MVMLEVLLSFMRTEQEGLNYMVLMQKLHFMIEIKEHIILDLNLVEMLKFLMVNY